MNFHNEEKEYIGKYTIKQLREIFNKYKNEDDAMDLKELEKLIKEQFDENFPVNMLGKLMKTIDLDKNGTVEFNEYVEFMKRIEELNEEILKEVFLAFDKKNNGYISPESLYHIFLSLGEPVKLEDLQYVFNENDLDGDGNLNFQDFKLLMRNGIEELHKKNSAFIGNSININNNNNYH